MNSESYEVFTMIGIPYFAYMIGALADLISVGIELLKQKHHLSTQMISMTYFALGVLFMVVVPAEIFKSVEGMTETKICQTSKFKSNC